MKIVLDLNYDSTSKKLLYEEGMWALTDHLVAYISVICEFNLKAVIWDTNLYLPIKVDCFCREFWAAYRLCKKFGRDVRF